MAFQDEYAAHQRNYSQLSFLPEDDDSPPDNASDVSQNPVDPAIPNGRVFRAQLSTSGAVGTNPVAVPDEVSNPGRIINASLKMSPAEGTPYTAYAVDGVSETVYNFNGHAWRIAQKNIRTGRIEIFEQTGADGRGSVKVIQGKPEKVAETHPQNISASYVYDCETLNIRPKLDTFKNPTQWDEMDRRLMDSASATPFKWLADGEDKAPSVSESKNSLMSVKMQRDVMAYVDSHTCATAQEVEANEQAKREGATPLAFNPVRPGLQALDGFVSTSTRADLKTELGKFNAARANLLEAQNQEMQELGRNIERQPERATSPIVAQVTKAIRADDGVRYRAMEVAKIIIEKRPDLASGDLAGSIRQIATQEPTYHREGEATPGAMKIAKDAIYDVADAAYAALKTKRPDLLRAEASTSVIRARRAGPMGKGWFPD